MDKVELRCGVEIGGSRTLTIKFQTISLRRAAIKLMKNSETNHPFYRAGFVLVGDGR